jgi:hypothetical protein
LNRKQQRRHRSFSRFLGHKSCETPGAFYLNSGNGRKIPLKKRRFFHWILCWLCSLDEPRAMSEKEKKELDDYIDEQRQW